MRIFYGVLAMMLWMFFLVCIYRHGVEIKNDVALITTAIIIAGAMAGGD